MNVSNKLSISRIVLTIIIAIVCLFPFYSIGISFPKININGLVVDLTYFVAGIFYILALLTNYLDGSIAKKTNTVSSSGSLLDITANKLLINTTLIILACRGFISGMVPLLYLFQNEIIHFFNTDLLKRGYNLSIIKSDKIKSISIMFGIAIMFFYNLPFELINLKVADFFIYFGTVMATVSVIEYYNLWKKVK